MTSLIWSFFMPFFRIDRAHAFFRDATVVRPELEPSSQFCGSCPHLGCPPQETPGSGLHPFHGFCFFVSTSPAPNSWAFASQGRFCAARLDAGVVPPGITQDLCGARYPGNVFLPISGTPGLHDRFASQLPGVPS